MRILMLTNTYFPQVGGVSQSVKAFSEEQRRQGHEVLVACPVFKGTPEEEEGVVRVPAIDQINGTEYSLPLPTPLYLNEVVDQFDPEILHSHHPFFMGHTAARLSASRNLPLVFTNHTRYEDFLHNWKAKSERLKRFVIELATGYANICDRVVAPSKSIEELLRGRGVHTPVSVIPTGVAVEEFARPTIPNPRARFDLPRDAFVVGHLGRLAPEKNIGFLARAAAEFLRATPGGLFLVAGEGRSSEEIVAIFEESGLGDRLRLVGSVSGERKIDCYHSMDVFAFASESETQGIVLAEAMACGVPVAAVDAPGSREIVQNRRNGRLAPRADAGAFVEALEWIRDLGSAARATLSDRARETSRSYSIEECAARHMEVYEELVLKGRLNKGIEESIWRKAADQLSMEWELFSRTAFAIGAAFGEEIEAAEGDRRD